MTVTFAQSWIQEGIAIGEAKGEAKGEVKGQAKSVIKFLSFRFGEVPSGIQKELMNLKDARRIEEMLELAATCQSLKEFQNKL